jgi:hypothetical protein
MHESKTDNRKFLRDVIKVTTGWRIEGLNSKEEALRRIEGMCSSRLRKVDEDERWSHDNLMVSLGDGKTVAQV